MSNASRKQNCIPGINKAEIFRTLNNIHFKKLERPAFRIREEAEKAQEAQGRRERRA